MRFKRLALLFIVGCAVFCANAVSVAFQIVQHGDSEIRSSSYVIEEGLFDFFFGKGIIISNSPAIASDSVENDASFFEKSRQEAWEGGVIILWSLQQISALQIQQIPTQIFLRIFQAFHIKF